MNLLKSFSAFATWAVLNGTGVAAESAGHGTGGGGGAGDAASKGAQDAMKSFKFDAGLKASVFATEPLVINPVAISQDERGRWYVAETYRQEKGVEDNRAHSNWLENDIAARTVEDRLATLRKFYPDAAAFAKKFTTETERLTRIEDSDGDGVADKEVILDDHFRDPLDGTMAGVLARGSDVWVTNIPSLWHFRDSDGDGKPELKEALLTGFGVKVAFRGHDMHGLRFGPDGKLYFSIGDRGINVKTKEGPTVASPDTGSIMRCNPDGTGFEVFATGVRNPQELAFDQYGNLFTGDNNSDSGDKARFVNLVEGGDCGWRMAFQYLPDRGPWNREMLWDSKLALEAKYIIPPIANVGNGPSGLTYNPGTALSARYQNQFFLCDFRGGAAASEVHQIALEPAGAWFRLKTVQPFVTGVLTTDCEFGNDGSLYVADWVASWSGVGKGRIYKFTDSEANTALQAETAKLISEGMSKRAGSELLTLLGHADMRVRMAAQFELAGKGAESVAGLSTLAQDGKAPQLARLHAIWGLGQIGDKNALAHLVSVLSDPDAEVRAQVLKVLGEGGVAATGEKMIGALKDPSPRVRYFAAQSLGKLKVASAVEPLFEMLAANNDQDPVLRHGGVMGLTACATAAQLAGKVKHESVAVRVGAVLALRRQESAEVAQFLNDSDQSVLLEVSRAIHDVPIQGAFPALAALSSNPNIKNPRILERVLNANYRLGKAGNARAIADFAARAGAPDPARKDALEALGAWARPSARDRLLNLWRPLPDRGPEDAIQAVSGLLAQLLKDGPEGVQEAAAKVAANLAITSAGEPLAQLVASEKVPTAARIAALQALAKLKDTKYLSMAAKAALQSKAARLRSEGLQVLANSDPVAAVTLILDIIQGGAVLEKQGALVALTEIKRPEATALLATLMDSLLAGKVAPEIQLDVYEAAKKGSDPVLKRKVVEYEAALAGKDPLTPYKLALAGGNADRGRKIFREKAEVQCLRCHKCEIGDSLVGPELTKVGASKNRDYLLESIVFPNKTIAQGFGIVSLTLQDGKSVAGRLVGEDAVGLRLETMDGAGKPQTLSVTAASIKERVNAPSPMPETTRDNLSKAELRDLVEYLATRK